MSKKCKCSDGHCAERFEAFKAHPCTAVIQTSTIPDAGKGLFADKDYARNDFVTYYSGRVFNTAIEGDRVLQINKRTWIDGSGPCTSKDAPGDFLNHKLPSNTRFVVSSHPLGLVTIRTTKAVKKGDEFFIDYGREYRESNSIPKTKKVKTDKK